MYAAKIFALAFAALVASAPADPVTTVQGAIEGAAGVANGNSAGNPTASDVSANCGQNQTLNCCQSSTQGGLNLIPSFVCNPIDFTIIGGNVPFKGVCGGNQAMCCTGNQATGLANFQCNNVHL